MVFLISVFNFIISKYDFVGYSENLCFKNDYLIGFGLIFNNDIVYLVFLKISDNYLIFIHWIIF